MRRLVFAAAVTLATIAGAAADTVSSLGINPTSGVGAFSNTNPGTGLGGSGAFVDLYNFQLVGNQILTIAFATNTYAGGAPQFISGFEGAVLNYGPDHAFMGGDDTLVIGPTFGQPCAGIPNCQTFGGSAVLPSGFYGLLIAGNAGVDAGYGGNLSTFAVVGEIPEVPLPPAVWLFLSGLLALFSASKREKIRAWFSQRAIATA